MVGSVYIGNFGRRNWAWELCKSTNTIAVIDDAAVHEYWLEGDKPGYMAAALEKLKSATGDAVVEAAATRWWNHNQILAGTAGDLWIHQDGTHVWWTNSGAEAAVDERMSNPFPDFGSAEVYLTRKPCQPWSNKDAKGNVLHWDALHPCAQDLIFTIATFVQPNAENRRFIRALIAGDDLSEWTESPEWQEKLSRRKRKPGTYFNDRRKTFARMAMEAMNRCGRSGHDRVGVYKDIEFRFRDYIELEELIDRLFEMQDGLCALTGLPMTIDTDPGSSQLRCSVDRIDSNGHYEAGNLQLVCRFANRWKSDSDDREFRALIALVRTGSIDAAS